MDSVRLQQLIERIAGLLRAESRGRLYPLGLQPVQFDALCFLSVCNRYSNTPMGVAEYLGQTKGSVSQSLKILERNGLVEKRADRKDKRVAHLHVTAAGMRLVHKHLPSPMLDTVGQRFDAPDAAALEKLLEELLRSMQLLNQRKTFGQCASCVHNVRDAGGRTLCGLTREVLSDEDVLLVCREHAVGF